MPVFCVLGATAGQASQRQGVMSGQATLRQGATADQAAQRQAATAGQAAQRERETNGWVAQRQGAKLKDREMAGLENWNRTGQWENGSVTELEEWIGTE